MNIPSRAGAGIRNTTARPAPAPLAPGFPLPAGCRTVCPGSGSGPPGPPPPIEMPAGDYNNQLKVKLTLEATEVDLFKNDVGKTDIDLWLDCPKPGEEPRVHDREISVGVVESPRIAGKASIFTLEVRLVIGCG